MVPSLVRSSVLGSDQGLAAAAAAAAKSPQSCPTLCDPIDGSPPGSPVPGILQARTLEWVAISFSNAWKVKSESEVAQSSPTPRDSMDCSLPGSSIHGICQARVLEWGAIAFSAQGLGHRLFSFFPARHSESYIPDLDLHSSKLVFTRGTRHDCVFWIQQIITDNLLLKHVFLVNIWALQWSSG